MRSWLLSYFAFKYFGIGRIPSEGNFRNASCALSLISTFSLLSLGRYLCWWTISPCGYYPPNGGCL